MNNYIIENRLPTIDEWIEIRENVGWTIHLPSEFEEAIKNTVFGVVAINREEIIGMGRIVGDGIIAFYIHDIVVKKEYQHKGVGTLIVNQLLVYICNNAAENSYIAGISARKMEPFYKKFGFEIYEGEEHGRGMVLKYKTLTANHPNLIKQ